MYVPKASICLELHCVACTTYVVVIVIFISRDVAQGIGKAVVHCRYISPLSPGPK